MSVIDTKATFTGERREDGRAGECNRMIIPPLHDLPNAPAEALGRRESLSTRMSDDA